MKDLPKFFRTFSILMFLVNVPMFALGVLSINFTLMGLSGINLIISYLGYRYWDQEMDRENTNALDN